jgi:hypothetical protein
LTSYEQLPKIVSIHHDVFLNGEWPEKVEKAPALDKVD